jgi:hypothetical protein
MMTIPGGHPGRKGFISITEGITFNYQPPLASDRRLARFASSILVNKPPVRSFSPARTPTRLKSFGLRCRGMEGAASFGVHPRRWI